MTDRLERFNILDCLRAVLATWVTIGHLGVFPLMGAHPGPGLPHFIDRFLNSTVWGMPAVMAFFVISGFCIHYPMHNGKALSLPQFYARRYLRTLIPVAVVVAILAATRDDIVWKVSSRDWVFFSGTLWSLLCEEIYYALYPLLRAIRQRVGWAPIVVATTIWSIGLASVATPARDWFDIGPLGTAAILYPVWILGCILAEQAAKTKKTVSTRGIWSWRAGAWGAMWVSEALNFHTPVSQVHTMLFVGAIAFLWIRAEINYGRTHAAPGWLRKVGAWSYSLYLVHPLVFHEFDKMNHGWAQTRLGWIAEFSVALILAYVFFLLIERPAHMMAKQSGKLVLEKA